MTLPGGKLTALASHPTKAEELYISINIGSKLECLLLTVTAVFDQLSQISQLDDAYLSFTSMVGSLALPKYNELKKQTQ
jgi:hypothetical protein